MVDDFVRPRPPARAMDIHELRTRVKANDKFAIARAATVDEAVKLVVDGYGTDDDSARKFVLWIKGDGTSEKPPRSPPVERLRRGCDAATGKEAWLDPDGPPSEKPPKKKR